MIHIFIGENSYSIAGALAKLKEGLGAGDLTEANTAEFEAEKITPEELGLQITAMPFLAAKRIVIVRGLIGRFEKKEPKAKKSKSSTAPPDNFQAEAFAGIINNKPPSTVLVLVDRAVSRTNPLYKQLGTHISLKEFPLLKGRELEEWIKQCVNEHGSRIRADATALLACQIGSDLWAMANEIEKLSLFAGEHEITTGHVNKLVNLAAETNIFQVVDAVVEGKCSQAELGLKNLIENGVSPSHILAMLTRQIRMVTLARDMLNRRVKQADIQNALGIKHDFVLRKTLEQARRYQLWQLKVFYDKLLEADRAIKTSRYDPELALSLLVEDLARVRVKTGS